MANNATRPVPDPPETDLAWDDFFSPLVPGLVFECNSTVFGRYDSVCVYRDTIVIDGSHEMGTGVEIPVTRISDWSVEPDGDAARVTIWALHAHEARIPLEFARALESALRDVIGTDPARKAA